MADHILTQPSEAELANAVQGNLFDLFRAMARSLDGEIEETDRLCRHLAFPTNPMYKGVWRTRLSAAEADEAIDTTIGWFKSHSAPFFFWWTGPGTTPDDLGERLIARGLISMEEQAQQLASGMKFTGSGSPGMVADLQHMNEAALAQAPAGFTIEEVRGEAALADFKRVLIAVYQVPEPMANGWVQAALRTGIGQTPWQLYLGRLNGEPVATNILFKGGGVAGVYGIGTVSSARGKGMGGAITLKPLLEARDEGYRYAMLFSTEIGIHAYERIGFRLTDAHLNRYLWLNQ